MKKKNENRDPIGGVAIALMIVGVLVMLMGGIIQQGITNREQKEEEENSWSYYSSYNPDFTGIWIMIGGLATTLIGFLLFDHSKKWKNYVKRQKRKQNDLYYKEYLKYKNKYKNRK